MQQANQPVGMSVRTELLPRCTILLNRPASTACLPGAPACEMYVPLMGAIVELRALIARQARPDETTAIAGVLLSAAGRPGEPQASTTGTVMAIIAQGTKRLAIGDRVYDYGPGQYLVASVDLPITGHYTHAAADEPALGFGLILRPQSIASLLLDADGRADAAATPPPAPAGLGVAHASPEFLDAVVRMVRRWTAHATVTSWRR